jgi:hypothetical protein
MDWQRISFGESGDIGAPKNHQSICAGYDPLNPTSELIYYFDNSPTLGSPNDTTDIRGSVKGVVVDTMKNPIDDARIIIDVYYPIAEPPDTLMFLSDEQGKFKFYRIAEKQTIVIRKDNYKKDTLTFQIQPDSSISLDTIMLESHITSAVEQSVISNYQLNQNFPNPFNPETKIEYTVGQIADLSANKTPVSLKIYDILGRKVKTLVNQHQKPGTYEITFHANDLPSGVYLYQLKAGKFEKVRKMVLAK